MNTPVGVLWKHRKPLYFIVRNEVRKRYAGSVLGLAWLVVYPVLFLALYAGVYLFIFKVKIPELSNWNYILIVFSGLVPYLGFCEALQQGSQSLVQNSNLLKNTVFPIELIPVKTVLCSQLAFAVTLAVLGVFIISGGHLNQRLWLVPLVFCAQYLLVQGLVWILASLSVVLKDVQPLLNLGLLFLLFISPIAFTPDMVPSALRGFLFFNPLYYLISLYRAGFFESQALRMTELLALYGMSLVFFIGGFSFFRKLQETFAEYV